MRSLNLLRIAHIRSTVMNLMPRKPPSLYIEPPDPPRVLVRMIGSLTFKWILGGIGAALIALLIMGWNAQLVSAASKNTDVVGAVADINVLKARYVELKTTSDVQALALGLSEASEKSSREVQTRIFEAIKGIGNDVHDIDKHLSAVGQKVEDQGEQLRELRAERK